MMGRRGALLLLAGITVLVAWAGPRDVKEIRRAATRVLASSGMIKAEEADGIRLMESRRGLSVMGNDSTFAIVAEDDAFPEVLAYSPTSYETAVSNPHFNWWVRMAERAVEMLKKLQQKENVCFTSYGCAIFIFIIIPLNKQVSTNPFNSRSNVQTSSSITPAFFSPARIPAYRMPT